MRVNTFVVENLTNYNNEYICGRESERKCICGGESDKLYGVNIFLVEDLTNYESKYICGGESDKLWE